MPHDCDVIVVGAGIIGCAIGREVASRGLGTCILEARDVAAGATQASAGMLVPYIEAPDDGGLHGLAVRSFELYDEFIDDLRGEGAEVEYRRCGTLQVAPDAAGAADLSAQASWIRSQGVEARWLTASETAAIEPAVRAPAGALLVPTHGYVRAEQLTAALLESAKRHGADFFPHQHVEQIAHDGDRISVTAGEVTYRASTIVVAAGSWSGLVINDGPPVSPVRGQLVRLRWQGPPIGRVLWRGHSYIVPWVDGTLLVGATMEEVGFDERATAGGVALLLEAARALLPEAGSATFLEARAGLRPSTPNGLPIIARAPEHPSVIYATGHHRNGILLAPLTAKIVAGLVTNPSSQNP
jgi:glycine oxidase